MVTRSLPKGIQRKNPANKPVKQQKQVATQTSPVKSDIQEILDLHTKHLLQMDELLSSVQDELKAIKGLVTEKKISQTEKAKTPAKTETGTSWHVLIEPDRKYTQKEIIGITNISQPTLSMAKARGHIVTSVPVGERGWVVRGSDLLTWDSARAIHADKKPAAAKKKTTPAKKKTPVKTSKTQQVQADKSKVLVQTPVKTTAVTVQKKEPKALTTQVPAKTVKTPVAPKKVVSKVVKTAPAAQIKAVKTPAVPKTQSRNPNLIPNDVPDRINALTQKKKITQTEFGNAVDMPQKMIYEISTRKLKELSPENIQKITSALKKFESK